MNSLVSGRYDHAVVLDWQVKSVSSIGEQMVDIKYKTEGRRTFAVRTIKYWNACPCMVFHYTIKDLHEYTFV
jgi:hypothetical protein